MENANIPTIRQRTIRIYYASSPKNNISSITKNYIINKLNSGNSKYRYEFYTNLFGTRPDYKTFTCIENCHIFIADITPDFVVVNPCNDESCKGIICDNCSKIYMPNEYVTFACGYARKFIEHSPDCIGYYICHDAFTNQKKNSLIPLIINLEELFEYNDDLSLDKFIQYIHALELNEYID